MFLRFNIIICSATLLVSQQVDSRRFRATANNSSDRTIRLSDMTSVLEAAAAPQNPTAMQQTVTSDNGANVNDEHVIEILPDTDSVANGETTVSRNYDFSMANLRAMSAKIREDGRLANEIVRKQLSAKMFGKEQETITETATEGPVSAQPESVSKRQEEAERKRQEAKFHDTVGKIIDHPLGCFLLCIFSPVLIVLLTILDACFN